MSDPAESQSFLHRTESLDSQSTTTTITERGPSETQTQTRHPPIYLDYNATTPICEEACRAMEKYLKAGWPHGNPSSGHGYGLIAKEIVETSRTKVAKALGCKEDEIVFTSGGTESNNWAIIGAALQCREKDTTKNHIVTSTIEHPAVAEVCKYLQKEHGFDVTFVPVDNTGLIDLKAFEESLTEHTCLVTVMHANNETGTVQPISQLSKLAKAKGDILVHTDAAQSIGKVPVQVDDIGVDLLSVCSHKFYGPKGIGALYIRPGVSLKKFMHGAGHERGWRAGTENVLEIIGMSIALEMVSQRLPDGMRHMQGTRNTIHQGLIAALGAENVHLNGHPEERLSNTLNVSLRAPGSESWTKAVDILQAINHRIAASAGSACHSGCVSVSPVLTAMQVPTDIALGALRLSTGRYLRPAEATETVEVIAKAVKDLSLMS